MMTTNELTTQVMGWRYRAEAAASSWARDPQWVTALAAAVAAGATLAPSHRVLAAAAAAALVWWLRSERPLPLAAPAPAPKVPTIAAEPPWA